MPVLVTGATGHIGNTLCRKLVDQGREVRAMVRSTSDTTPLRDLPVELVEANLLVPESLEQAAQGCEVVFHTAAVYKIWADNPDLEIIQPAVEGTRNILHAAQKTRVGKVLYVSSAVALGPGEQFQHERSESDWFNDAQLPYNVAKIQSEKIAHALGEELDLDIIFVLPGLVLGAYDYKITPSTLLVKDFLLGKLPVYYDSGYSVAHVEDVVNGMIQAEKRGTRGHRYILGGEQITIPNLFAQLEAMTKRKAPAIRMSPGAGKVIAYPLKWLASLFHSAPLITPEFVEDYFNKYYNFSSEKARQELGYEHRSLLRTLEDTINWLIERNEVPSDVREVENL